jgi:hypothetical protein
MAQTRNTAAKVLEVVWSVNQMRNDAVMANAFRSFGYATARMTAKTDQMSLDVLAKTTLDHANLMNSNAKTRLNAFRKDSFAMEVLNAVITAMKSAARLLASWLHRLEQ